MVLIKFFQKCFTLSTTNVNSLWPTGAIWQHWSGSTLAQVMMIAPSLLISHEWVLWHLYQSNFLGNTHEINLQDEFENCIFKVQLLPHLPGANELIPAAFTLNNQRTENRGHTFAEAPPNHTKKVPWWTWMLLSLSIWSIILQKHPEVNLNWQKNRQPHEKTRLFLWDPKFCCDGQKDDECCFQLNYSIFHHLRLD